MATNDPGGGRNTSDTDSYAKRLKTNVKFDHRLKRNVLEITLEKTSDDSDNEVTLSQEAIAKLFKSLKLDITTQVEGYQVMFHRGQQIISVWVAQGVNLDKFCVMENINIGKGLVTGAIRPAGRQDVIVSISGLDFNTPDTLVHEYIQKFGGHISTNSVNYSRFSEGPFCGKYTGERKYRVNFTDLKRHMGTYHYLDGARVRIFYRGNIKTCGRCHKSAHNCPGGALAKICEEKGGHRVSLADHMRKVWTEIDFSPTSFELPDSVDEVRDIPISELSNNEQSGSDKLGQTQPIQDDRFIGLRINNFPLEMSNNDVLQFINEKLSKNIPDTNIDIVRTKKSSNVTISKGLDTTSITHIMEQIDFVSSKNLVLRLPLYCRPIRDLTPEKLPESDDLASSYGENLNKSLSHRNPLPRIPGLPPKAQRQALAKERLKLKKSAEKDNKNVDGVNGKSSTPKSAFDVLMQNSKRGKSSPSKSPILSITSKRGSSQLDSPTSPSDNDPKRNKNNTPQ